MVVGYVYFIVNTSNKNPDDTNIANKTNIRFYYDKPLKTLSPTPPERIAFVSIPTPVSASPSLDSGTETTRTSVSSKPSIRCEVRDLLGAFIQSGTITTQTQNYPFQNGYAQIPVDNIENETCVLEAHSEGYQPASQTIHKGRDDYADFQLDYFCDFSVQVISEELSKKEIQGATVYFYQKLSATRPLLKQLQPAFFTQNRDDNSNVSVPCTMCQIRVDDNQLRVMKASDISNTEQQLANLGSHGFHFETSSSDIAAFTPQKDDFILSVGSAAWSGNFFFTPLHRSFSLPINKTNTERMRILDTFSLSRHTRNSPGTTEHVLINRDRLVGNCYINIPTFSGREDPVKTLVTDSYGRCQFQNVYPGLYFVQAVKENGRSMIRPLYPAVGGTILKLHTRANLTVRTGLMNDVSKYDFTVWLKDVSVLIQPTSKENSGFYTSKTNRRGIVSFQSLPFGSYQLIAHPPKNADLAPIEQKIEITSPQQEISLFFSDWDRHTIEGEVVLLGTKEPVADISVDLLRTSFGSYNPCATTRTDQNGKFSFPDLPKGRYKVACYPDTFEEMKYYPYDESMNTDRRVNERPFIGQGANELTGDYASKDIDVFDRPIYFIQIKMIDCIQTRFVGKVTYPNQQPAKDAELTIRPFGVPYLTTKKITHPYPPITDEEGLFDFVLFTKAVPGYDSIVYQGDIRAKFNRRDSETNTDLIYSPNQKIVPESTGYKKLEFTLGQTINNIHIIVDPNNVFSLEGKLLTEDGLPITHAQIEMFQNELNVPGILLPNGEFQFPGLEKDYVSIIIMDARHHDPNADPPTKYYVDESVFFTREQILERFPLPQKGEEILKMEITLKRAGFLQGRVVDSQNSPAYKVFVTTSPTLQTGGHTAITDQKGNFIIQRLPLDQTYSLYTLNNDQSDSVLRYTDLPPNLDNITIQLE